MKLCRSILSLKIFWNPSAEMKTDSNELPKTYSNIFWTSCYPNTYSGLFQFKPVSNITSQIQSGRSGWSKRNNLYLNWTVIRINGLISPKCSTQWRPLKISPSFCRNYRSILAQYRPLWIWSFHGLKKRRRISMGGKMLVKISKR